MSRKHGLFNLSQQYLDMCKAPLLDIDTKGEMLKLERFKYRYETFKLHLAIDQKGLEMIQESSKFLECTDYDLWMHAEILRL